MKKRVSLATIAKEAGCTQATVSLALRNNPRIPESTRTRIQAIADRLGYRPHAEVSRLMGLLRETKAPVDRPGMALIYDHPNLSSSGNPSSQETWKGFKKRALELGYRPEEFFITPEMSGRRVVQILSTRGIRALVFAALINPTIVAEMDLSGFCCASIGNVIRNPKLPRATSDKYTNTLRACEELWTLGLRRIALIIPLTQEERVENTFLSGYLTFHHRQKHQKWQKPLIYEEDWEDQAALKKWVQTHKPDGILAAYSHITEIIDPDRFKIALINTENHRMIGIDQCHSRIAHAAVELADAQFRRNEIGVPKHPKTVMVTGEWCGERS